MITQLWNDFSDVDADERNVVDVEGAEPEVVARTVTSRWVSAALCI